MEHASTNSAGASQGSLRSYITGFVLAIVLTAIPFALVMNGTLPREAAIFAVFTAAVVQILVHLHYFLHLDGSSEERWNVLAILFTAVIILILVAGSIWIMFNMNARMMDSGAVSMAARLLRA